MRNFFLFSLVNVLISALIAIKFFVVPGTAIMLSGGFFAIFATLSNFFLINLLLFILCLPLLFLSNKWRNGLLALVFGLAQIAIYTDTLVFEQYRFHINESVLSMVLFGQVVEFSIATCAVMVFLLLAVVSVEYLIIFLIDKIISKRRANNSPQSRVALFASLFFIFTLLVNNIGYMVAFYYSYSPVMVVKEYLPIYYPLTSKKIMRYFDKEGQKRNIYANSAKKSHVIYPLRELNINTEGKKPYNILFLVLDSWRFDTFTEEVSPNTWNFVKAQNGVAFQQHYSTGNATRTGIFGLFYGIPGTYWQSFLNNSLPSPLITTMQKENYNIGVFSSAKITFPEFDRTVFATVKDLRIQSEGKSASERDAVLTKDWITWYKNRDSSRPTFSFLFYDATHAYDFPADFDVKFTPVGDVNYMTLKNNTDPTPMFNRYKQSVYYIDSLLQKVYDELEASSTLDNTLIVITGDHAQEMNDNRLGFWGHNGNFTDAQTKVPFIIIGAKDVPLLAANTAKLTSHEDVLPTLMKHYLHVTNDTRDYSTGYDLFSDMPQRKWLLLSNYSSWAIRTPENIYMVNGVGISHYMDSHNRETSEKPDYHYLREAMDEMTHFVDTGVSTH